MKNIYFIILTLLIIVYIIRSIRKGKLGITVSFGWMIASILLLILSIFPYSLDWLAKLLGIAYPPALLFTLCIIFLVILNFNYSKKIAIMNEKIIDLAQEVSLLKNKK